MTSQHDRDLLLAYLYDALEQPDRSALEARLVDEPELRAALDGARDERALLDEAASLPADDLVLSRRGTARIFTARGMRAAAAVLVAATVALGAHQGVAQALVAGDQPVVHVTGPGGVTPGGSAEYVVRLGELDGDGLPGSIRARLVDGNGEERASATVSVDETGTARIVLAPDVPRPGEWYVAHFAAAPAAGDAADPIELRTRLRDTTRVVTRVAPDKPVYRPGETIRIRGVALESLALAPAGDVPLRIRLFDPRDTVVLDEVLESTTGVTAWEHRLATDAPGGAYRLELSGMDGQEHLVAPSGHPVAVRAYRVPRLLADVLFDRDAYVPGQEGQAWVEFERVEGGVPAGASVDAALHLDGVEVDRRRVTVGAAGTAVVPFRVPLDVGEGRARLALAVDDGGTVEGFTETVRLALGRLHVDVFPEGGTLVAGLPNRLYFRTSTADGAPADALLHLHDENGDRVASGRADVHGMGVMDVTPRAGSRLTLRADEPAGLDVIGDVPPVADGGVTLRALDDSVAPGAPLRIRVGATAGGVHVVSAWLRGHQIGAADANVAAGESVDVQLDLHAAAAGVVRVTVTDPSGVPVAERLVSRSPARSLDVTAQTDRDVVGPRETVHVTVNVRDESGHPATAILGASVVDEGVLALGDASIPLPLHFLLGMEVEELERTEIYAGGPGAPLAVDRLLGIQGWRRFAWRDADTFVAAHPVDGPRIVAVTADEVPVARSNESSVRSTVKRRRRKIDQRTTGLAVLAGLVYLLVGGVVVGLRAVWQHKPLAAAGGFAIPGLLLAFFALAVTGIGEKMAPGSAIMRATADAAGAAGMDMGAPESEAAWDAGDPTSEARQDTLFDNETGLDRVLVLRERLADAANVVGANGDEDVAFAESATLAGRGRRPMQVLHREYAHRAERPFTGERTDFAEVLYWRPLLVTNAEGQATFSFDTSDSVTRFRVRVDAHDGRGALGAGDTTLASRLPFHAEPKLPLEVAAGDRIDVPIALVNATGSEMVAGVSIDSSSDLIDIPFFEVQPHVTLAADGRGRVLHPIGILQGHGTSTLTIGAGTTTGLRDTVQRVLRVVPRGYPVTLSHSGVVSAESRTRTGDGDGASAEGVRAEFTLPETFDATSLRGGLRLYPSTLAALVDGLDGLLREPHGCFEQTSSSNYPNVLVLAYLEEQGMADPVVARRARDLLAKGYDRLASFECSDGGFEWFGQDPGHEALTAYGLVQFTDMAAVHDVDQAMVERTRSWLLARRDGNGGFRFADDNFHSFGGASRTVNEAYLVWALTEAGSADAVATELDHVTTAAATSDDPYELSLVALALSNAGDDRARGLVDRLAKLQAPDGRLPGGTTSITSSRGTNLDVETTALAVQAFDRHPDRLGNAEAGIRWVLAQRRDGTFGATQATVLALRALTSHARAARSTATDHDVEVWVNGAQVADRHVAAGEPGAIEFGDEVLAALVRGKNAVDIRTSGEEPLPWALTVGFHTQVPASDPDCPVRIETALSAERADEGAGVEMTAVVRNATNEALPMTIARIGFPAGLEARPERLDALRERGAFAFYELGPREVTLYWRSLPAHAEKRVVFDFVAAVPGSFEGPASAAYLYYGDDAKHWAAPSAISIVPR